uniref:Uncharacterized protein n=1 Tax=Rhizophora mucronata TaxID=61149 RepID=A0A2P2R2V2_RHIMU
MEKVLQVQVASMFKQACASTQHLFLKNLLLIKTLQTACAHLVTK